jgi:glycosyltransferase involved in cell wall biosynthesis
VVSYSTAALGETVADGGLLFHEKRWETVAALLDVVVRDDRARARLVEAGRRRVAELRPERFEARVLALMDEIAAMDYAESAPDGLLQSS